MLRILAQLLVELRLRLALALDFVEAKQRLIDGVSALCGNYTCSLDEQLIAALLWRFISWIGQTALTLAILRKDGLCNLQEEACLSVRKDRNQSH